MSIGYSGKRRFVSLLIIVGLMIAGGSAWSSHECCEHPSGSRGDTDSGAPKALDDDCACACCQAEKAISPLSGISFQFDSWWSVEDAAAFAVSRFETDIFRPPLA